MAETTPLPRDERGVALIEFGLLAPVMMIMLFGAIDVGHRLYARAALQGSVQKAARDTGLEGGTLAERQLEIDKLVREHVQRIHNRAEVTFERRAYRNFTRAASPAEGWSDTNLDGQCNAGEPFDDVNRNGIRDLDVGVKGQGGAEDAVLYTVRMTYPSVAPVWGLFGLDPDVDLTAQTVLRNQPYNAQGSDPPPLVGNCK